MRQRCFGSVLAALGALAVLLAPARAHVRISTDITWSEDIRPILRRHCMNCHSPGGPAPSYVDLRTYGTDSAPGAPDIHIQYHAPRWRHNTSTP